MCSNCSGEYENPDETNEPIEQPACEHLRRRINLSTAMVSCLDCGEDLMDLNPLLSDSLRVARNMP